jgi:very-short-patch-repair endonuclease
MKDKQNNKGHFKKTAIWVDKTCENCGTTFQVKESDLKYGRGKCCSRKCVDENKKQTYLGNKNPMFGKTHSEEERLYKSRIMKDLWKTDTYRNQVKKSQDEFFERAADDGTWDRANEKRKQTWIKKIGQPSNFVGKYGERECDKTFIKKYGMSSHDYRNSILHNNRTSIELFTEFILNENNIENIPQYNYKGFSFDFYLPKENVLIECDGDYWHGFGKLDEELDDTQKRSRNNDKIKNKLTKSGNIKLLRFWEHEIHQDNFDKFLLEKIWEIK